MNIFYHKLFYIFFVNRINFKIIYPKKILFLVISSILLNSCSSEIKVQIVRPPVHKIEKIFFIEIGNFEFTEGEIFPPSQFDQGSSEKFSKNFNLLKPPITKFVSKENKNLKIIDLVRAKILHELSLNSPYKIYVKKNNKLGFSGIIPDNDKVAILNGKIKFFQKKIESKEELSYFTNMEIAQLKKLKEDNLLYNDNNNMK